MEIKFTVYGEPKALKRHRMYRHSGKLISVDPSCSDKNDFLVLAHSNKPNVPINTPIRLEVDFFFPRPKSHFGTGKNSKVLKFNAPSHHTSTPDIDNLIKFIMDALNSVFWSDDAKIYSISAFKEYSDNPRIEVKIIW